MVKGDDLQPRSRGFKSRYNVRANWYLEEKEKRTWHIKKYFKVLAFFGLVYFGQYCVKFQKI